jgi:hypothetical protein
MVDFVLSDAIQHQQCVKLQQISERTHKMKARLTKSTRKYSNGETAVSEIFKAGDEREGAYFLGSASNE